MAPISGLISRFGHVDRHGSTVPKEAAPRVHRGDFHLEAGFAMPDKKPDISCVQPNWDVCSEIWGVRDHAYPPHRVPTRSTDRGG